MSNIKFTPIIILLYFLHLMSYRISLWLGLEQIISFIGIVNILTILITVLIIAFSKVKITPSNRFFVKTIGILILFYIPSLIINFNLSSSFRIFSGLGSIVCANILASILFNYNKSQKLINKYLKLHFVIFSIIGIIHIIGIYSGYLTPKRDGRYLMETFIFEYPHSFGVYTAAILPLFLYQLNNEKNIRFYKIIAYIIMPIIMYHSGAKISLILYLLSLFITYRILNPKFKKILNFSVVIIILVFILYSTQILEYVNRNTFVAEIGNYINDYDNSTKKNSIDSRIGVWTYMYKTIESYNKLFVGMGWRSWDLKYNITLSNIALSSQSDYFTVLFEMGYIGLIGFIIYRIRIFIFLNSFRKNKFLIVPIIILLIGGISENVEWYSSTSWLLPFILAFSDSLQLKLKNEIKE